MISVCCALLFVWPVVLLVLHGHYWWNSTIYLVFPLIVAFVAAMAAAVYQLWRETDGLRCSGVVGKSESMENDFGQSPARGDTTAAAGTIDFKKRLPSPIVAVGENWGTSRLSPDLSSPDLSVPGFVHPCKERKDGAARDTSYRSLA